MKETFDLNRSYVVEHFQGNVPYPGVVALVYSVNGAKKLLTANVGDSRALLIQGGKAQQLTVDHVPDM